MKKRCCTCRKKKALKFFSKNKTQKKDGLQRACKACCKIAKSKFSKEYNRIKSQEWRDANKAKWRIYRKNWYDNNSQKWTDYMNKRRREDVYFRIVTNLRSRIASALKVNKKDDRTLTLLGCTALQFKKHLEAQFQLGMTWENYGKWHVDHIKPCAKFNLTTKEEQRKCFHYTNLQPLWAKENREKSDKYYE